MILHNHFGIFLQFFQFPRRILIKFLQNFLEIVRYIFLKFIKFDKIFFKIRLKLGKGNLEKRSSLIVENQFFQGFLSRGEICILS